MNARKNHPFIDQLLSVLSNKELKSADRNAQARELIETIAELNNLESQKQALYDKINKNQKKKIELQTEFLDFNVFDDTKNTPLYYAASHNDLDIVKLLLENKADPNLFNKEYGVTAIHFAEDHSNVEMVNLLVKYRANVNVKVFDGSAPLNAACKRLALEFTKADKNHYREIIKILCEAKADTNYKDQSGVTPLMHILEDDAIVRQLLHYKADPNLTIITQYTVLDFAKRPSIISLLLEHGATCTFPEVLTKRLLQINPNDPALPHAIQLFLKTEKVPELERYLKELDARHSLTTAAYVKFIDPGTVTPADLKDIYPEDKEILYNYQKNPKPNQNETKEEELARVKREADLKIIRSHFKAQFLKLLNRYQDWGVQHGVSASALLGLQILDQRFFDELITGAQTNEFFNSVKRDLEEIYVLLHKNPMDIDKRKQIFGELCEGFKVCGPGIGEHINYSKLLLANVQTVTGWLAQKRAHIIHELAAKYFVQHKNRLNLHDGNKIHVDVAFLKRAVNNEWAPFGEVQHIEDHFMGAVGLNDRHREAKEKEGATQRLKVFDDEFLAIFTPRLVMDAIYEGFLALCEAKAPEVYHQRWLGYSSTEDKNKKPPGAAMVDDVKKLLKVAELDELEADFFDQKNDYEFIKFNPELFKMRVVKWCYDKNFFQPHLTQKKVINPTYALVSFDQDNYFWIESKYEFLHPKNSTIVHPAWQQYVGSLTSEEQLKWLEKIDIKTFAPDAEQLGMLLARLKDQKQRERIIQSVAKEYFKFPQDREVFINTFPAEQQPAMRTILQPYVASVAAGGLFAKETKQENKGDYHLKPEEIDYLKELAYPLSVLANKSQKIKLACLKEPKLRMKFSGGDLIDLLSGSKAIIFYIISNKELLNKFCSADSLDLLVCCQCYEEMAMVVLENQEIRSKFEGDYIVAVAKHHIKAAEYVMNNKNLFPQCKPSEFEQIAKEVAPASKLMLSPDEIEQVLFTRDPRKIYDTIYGHPQLIRVFLNTPQLLKQLDDHMLHELALRVNIPYAIAIIKKINDIKLLYDLADTYSEFAIAILQDLEHAKQFQAPWLIKLATNYPDVIGPFILDHAKLFTQLNSEHLNQIKEIIANSEQILPSAPKPQLGPTV